jgi:hypothetical protein
MRRWQLQKRETTWAFVVVKPQTKAKKQKRMQTPAAKRTVIPTVASHSAAGTLL